ncbi:hypothetical protein M9Y10_001771 [Tritrichomonas musculus]|uniref:Uncharacterized protein n=1 Tax=Tritrichomonas musculus TaxID=1915356 RepID=A0ABR2L7X0_9EUKA
MQEDIDPNILKESSTPIKEIDLQLMLNKSHDFSKTDLINQINSKISFLSDEKKLYDERLNQKLKEFTNSDTRFELKLSEKIKEPLDSANVVAEQLSSLASEYEILKGNSESLLNIKNAAQKREKLKILKKEITNKKKYYALYEEIKYQYEHRNFMKVAQLYQQAVLLDLKDMSLITNLLANFPKVINDELFRICTTNFSISSLLQCLICIKNPKEAVDVIEKNVNFNFEKSTFQSIFDTYQHRFDVIYAISCLKEERSILAQNGEQWKIPSLIWQLLNSTKNESKPSTIDTIKDSFHSFIKNKKTDALSLISSFQSEWKRWEPLLFLTNSYQIIAFKIARESIAKMKDDAGKFMGQILTKCFDLYNFQSEDNNRNPSVKSCMFIQGIIESTIIFLINKLISNDFNTNESSLKPIVEKFDLKSKSLNIIELNEIKLVSGYLGNQRNGPYALSFLQNFVDTVNKDTVSPLMSSFYQNGFDEVILSVNDLHRCMIPLYISENDVLNCINEAKNFIALNLKKMFLTWGSEFGINPDSLKQYALEYFCFIKEKNLPSKGGLKSLEGRFFSFFKNSHDPKDLFDNFYDLQ